MEKVYGVSIMNSEADLGLMEFARNLFFGVDNSLSSHTDNWKNNFLVLDEGPTDGVNDSAVQLKKI